MTSYPLPTLGPTITDAGITIPSFNDVYLSLQASFQGIYGSAAVLDPSSQDGQMLAIIAQAITDCNDASVALYNSYGPATSSGAALSSAVKINAMARQKPTYSTVSLTIGGVAHSNIPLGQASDDNKFIWVLPANTTIPDSGTTTVTAVCSTIGAVTAAIGTITTIANPTLGWQSVTNAVAAVPGAPVEIDGALRQRQATSTALPSSAIMAGILGAVAGVTGVTAYGGHENDKKVTDNFGVPGNTIWIVVYGGNPKEIAQAIASKKTPGTQTYGSQSVQVVDSTGLPATIHFDYYVQEPILVNVATTKFTGFATATLATIQASVVDFINSQAGGQTLYLNQVLAAAALPGTQVGTTFTVSSISMSISPAGLSSSNIALLFNQIPITSAANVVVS